jgi:hypothetical protein
VIRAATPGLSSGGKDRGGGQYTVIKRSILRAALSEWRHCPWALLMTTAKMATGLIRQASDASGTEMATYCLWQLRRRVSSSAGGRDRLACTVESQPHRDGSIHASLTIDLDWNTHLLRSFAPLDWMMSKLRFLNLGSVHVKTRQLMPCAPCSSHTCTWCDLVSSGSAASQRESSDCLAATCGVLLAKVCSDAMRTCSRICEVCVAVRWTAFRDTLQLTPLAQCISAVWLL